MSNSLAVLVLVLLISSYSLGILITAHCGTSPLYTPYPLHKPMGYGHYGLHLMDRELGADSWLALKLSACIVESLSSPGSISVFLRECALSCLRAQRPRPVMGGRGAQLWEGAHKGLSSQRSGSEPVFHPLHMISYHLSLHFSICKIGETRLPWSK